MNGMLSATLKLAEQKDEGVRDRVVFGSLRTRGQSLVYQINPVSLVLGQAGKRM